MKSVLLVAGLGVPFPFSAVAQGLTVTGVAPSRNAVSVPRTSSVGVSFSQTLSASSGVALRVFSSQRRGLLAGTATVSGNALTFRPTREFKPGEIVRATLTSAALSSTGAGAMPQVFEFVAAAQGGTGQFAGGSQVGVGTAPGSLATGDVDGDGDLDLVVANTGFYNAQGNTVSVRLNNGTGTFAAPASGAELTVGTQPQKVVLGDVDADGDLDLLTANYGSNTVSLRLNNGSGSFAAPAVGAEVPVNAAASLALADVDADGDLDLLGLNGIYSAAANGSVSVRLNDGTGNFVVPAANATATAGNGPFMLTTADIDNDGDLDLLVPNDGASHGFGDVSVRFNNGQGGFLVPATGAEVPMAAGTDAAVTGDVDGDGDVDLLAISFGGPTSIGRSAYLNLNDGTGHFTQSAAGGVIPVGTSPRTLTLGDVDGDGDLDLVVGNVGGLGGQPAGTTVSIRLNSGLNSGLFVAPASGAEVTVAASPYEVALADVDNDGDLDLLAVSTATNSVSVRLNNGTGAALAAASAAFAPALNFYPNPAHTVTTIHLPAIPGTTQATVTLVDGLGRTMRIQQVPLLTTGTIAEIPLIGLAPGLYHLRVQSGGWQSSRSLAVE